MKVGIGYGNHEDLYDLGKEIAHRAIKSSGIKKPSIALAFCNGYTGHENFLKGIRSIIGESIPIVGGSTIGIITNDYLSYEGNPAGVLIIESSDIEYHMSVKGKINENEENAGYEMVEKLNITDNSRTLFIIYDSIKVPATATTPPLMNASPKLLKGISSGLSENIPIFGVGVIGSFKFESTVQYTGFDICNQNVIGLLINGNIDFCHKIIHGCTPMDGIYHKITKIDGSIVHEIDGKPAAEVIDGVYKNKDWRKEHPVNILTLGINHGEKFDDFIEENYVNRLITGILPDEKSIGIFEPDLEEGSGFQFMLRDSGNMIESARNNSEELIKEIEASGKKPVFALYINCGGRSASFSHTKTEEAAEVQKVLSSKNIPLLGVYSGVEIAPVMGTSRGLDWTGVLIIGVE